MAHEPAHIIRLQRWGTLTSDTLDPALLAELQALYKAQPWYSDKLARKPFRKRVFEIMRQTGRGMIFLGHGIRFEAPPPFMEFFEPIQLGTNDPQLKTLSGTAATRQEKAMKILIVLGCLGLIAAIAPLLIAYLRGQVFLVGILVTVFVGTGAFAAGIAYFVHQLMNKWFILPAAVAIRPRNGAKQKLLMFTPKEAGATLRWVSNGKTSMLFLELWPAEGKSWRRAVTEREAMTFLAAWRSDEVAPPVEKLEELLAN